MTDKRNPYDLKKEVKWYQTLWDMRDRDFRGWYVKRQRRELRMYWKYRSHQFMEKAGFGSLLAAVVIYVCQTDIANALLRWPTEDVNELLKQPVWKKYRSQVNERKENASKMLEESNYQYTKNNPTANMKNDGE